MMPSPDPLRPRATDRDDELPSGAAAAFAVIAWMVLIAFIIGVVIGRITA